jgi:hypothetical protein
MPPRKELPIEGVSLESTYMELFDAELPQSNTASTKLGQSLDEEEIVMDQWTLITSGPLDFVLSGPILPHPHVRIK